MFFKNGECDSGGFERKTGPIEVERKFEEVQIKILCLARWSAFAPTSKEEIIHLLVLVIIFLRQRK